MTRCPRCYEIAPCSRCIGAPQPTVSWGQTIAGIGFILLFAGLFIVGVI